MKIIQVPMEEGLLRAVSREAKVRRSSRAALIREACQEYLRKLETQELERQYVEGYRRMPEKTHWGKVGAKLTAQVWPKESWDEAR